MMKSLGWMMLFSLVSAPAFAQKGWGGLNFDQPLRFCENHAEDILDDLSIYNPETGEQVRVRGYLDSFDPPHWYSPQLHWNSKSTRPRQLKKMAALLAQIEAAETNPLHMSHEYIVNETAKRVRKINARDLGRDICEIRFNREACLIKPAKEGVGPGARANLAECKLQVKLHDEP